MDIFLVLILVGFLVFISKRKRAIKLAREFELHSTDISEDQEPDATPTIALMPIERLDYEVRRFRIIRTLQRQRCRLQLRLVGLIALCPR
jgi:hypothetical protein